MSTETELFDATPEGRASRCKTELDKLLSDLRCELTAVPGFITDNRGGWVLVTRIDILAKR